MMGLFDFIKKNPSVDTSRLPEFENYGQSPESFSNFQFSRSNQGVKPDKTKVEQPVIPVSSAEQVRAATNQAMQEQTEKKPTTPDDVFTALLRERYQESEDSLKRQRAAEFWGNLANLFGQTVSSAAGARMFSQKSIQRMLMLYYVVFLVLLLLNQIKICKRLFQDIVCQVLSFISRL
jgi:hypothetical protein